MKTEFQPTKINHLGFGVSEAVGQILSDTLERLEALGLVAAKAGRERAIVVTKLQEAGHFALDGIIRSNPFYADCSAYGDVQVASCFPPANPTTLGIVQTVAGTPVDKIKP